MKGETCKYPYKAEPPCDFNPRTHEGCDAEDTRIRDVVTDISIHAPMKGATYSFYDPVRAIVPFQSTHP